MLSKTTLAPVYWPLMDLSDMRPGHCVVCKRAHPIEGHHVVKRSAGELFRGGRKAHKPVIDLCGFGNVLMDPDGRYYCHGKAHHGLLHFRRGRSGLEYLDVVEVTGEAIPINYLTALGMEGWMPL